MREEMFEVERYEMQEPPAYMFHVTRREFVGALGAGLLLLMHPTDADAADTLDARLHIGEDGRITVLNGKIEEGQGARTELAMAAAEELRVSMQQIDVAMADTDLTPNDGVTAGSRTTPSTVPQVRRAAAAARELLISAAASKCNVARESLQVSNGAVSANGQALSYRDIARSKGPIPATVTITAPGQWQILGRSHSRPNGPAIVTGAHQYPSDIQRPGMLYGSVLRPPSYEAQLASIDMTAAKDAVAVRDGDFIGCAAPSSFEARKAVQALAATAKWKEKPQPSSDTLYQHLKQHGQPGASGRGGRTEGDVEAALKGAPKKFEATYTAAYIQHAPMEPRAAVAEWEGDKLTVWTGTSNPFAVRDQLAKSFGIAPRQVRVIVPDFGGGFGGKHTGEAAIEAARLAKEAKRPVSLRWTRAEEFTFGYCRPAALIEVQAALDDKKGLLAWDFVNYNSGASALDTPYRVPNVRVRFAPSQSPLRQGSYRALGSTANNFARESFMDELAEAAGADPLEFRLANLANDRIREVLIAATKKFGWEERRKTRHPNRGIGLACGTEKNSVVAACVEVAVDPATGTPKLLEIVEAFECGAILNPAGLRAQVEGCIAMGLGALREEILFENGRLKNAKFSAYRVPRFRDMPKMEIVLVDKKNAEPVGAGETPIIAVAPAMANAMFMAIGRRVRGLPLVPSRSS